MSVWTVRMKSVEQARELAAALQDIEASELVSRVRFLGNCTSPNEISTATVYVAAPPSFVSNGTATFTFNARAPSWTRKVSLQEFLEDIGAA